MRDRPSRTHRSRPTPRISRIALPLLALFAVGHAAVRAQSAAEERPPTRPAGEVSTATDAAAALPGITIDRERGRIDLDARVVLREGLLELVACPTGTKEHESIFAVRARPRHVHLALLMLGAEPGRPGAYRYDEADDRWLRIPPRGDRIAVTVLHDGKEVPVSRYIVNDRTGEPLPDHHFIFAGSEVEARETGRVYLADQSGNLLTLSTFGDDALSWPEPTTASNDQLMWIARTDAIPPLETELTLRLTPVEAEADPEASDE